jgi:transcriptional regulator with XRE-family HTH domain
MITYNLYLGDDVMKIYLKEVRKQKKMTLMQLEELSGLSALQEEMDKLKNKSSK